jgi:branched-chain amino acid transport system substrate-binding protein
MNGEVGPIGRQIRNGVELALIQSPLSTRYQNYDLKTSYMDNSNPKNGGRPDPEVGVQNIKDLLQQTTCPNPIAIIGPYDSSVAAAEIPLAGRNHILLLSSSNTATCLTQKSYTNPPICDYDILHPKDILNTFARLPATGAYQGYLIADFLLASPNPQKPGQGGLGAKKIFIVGSESSDAIAGLDVSLALKQRLENKGVKPISIDCVKPPEEYSQNHACSQLNPSTEAFSTDNIAALAAKIRDQKPDAIFFGGRPDQGGGLLRKQLGEFGLDQIPFVGPSSFVANKTELLKTMDPYRANVYAPSVADLSTLTSETATTFYRQYQDTFGEPPTNSSATGYDAAKIVLQVIKSLIDTGKPVTRESVTQGVFSSTFTGVRENRIRFDQNGDNIGQHVYMIYQSQKDFQGAWDMKTLT